MFRNSFKWWYQFEGAFQIYCKPKCCLNFGKFFVLLSFACIWCSVKRLVVCFSRSGLKCFGFVSCARVTKVSRLIIALPSTPTYSDSKAAPQVELPTSEERLRLQEEDEERLYSPPVSKDEMANDGLPSVHQMPGENLHCKRKPSLFCVLYVI